MLGMRTNYVIPGETFQRGRVNIVALNRLAMSSIITSSLWRVAF